MHSKNLTVCTDDCHRSQNTIESNPEQNKMPVKTENFAFRVAVDNKFRYNPHTCDLEH